MEVEIRYIYRKRWHGLNKKDDFKQPTRIKALVNPETYEYKTGLSEKDIKSLKDKGVQYDLSNSFDQETPHSFWDTRKASLELTQEPVFLNTDVTLSFIHFKLAQASDQVANSWEDYEKGLYPEATHYIHNAEATAEIKASKIQKTNEAIMAIASLNKKEKLDLVLVMKNKDLSNMSDNFLITELDNILKEDAQGVLTELKRDKVVRTLTALVNKAIIKGVIIKKRYSYEYLDGKIGDTIEDVIEFLQKPENNDTKIRIIQATNVK